MASLRWALAALAAWLLTLANGVHGDHEAWPLAGGICKLCKPVVSWGWVGRVFKHQLVTARATLLLGLLVACATPIVGLC